MRVCISVSVFLCVIYKTAACSSFFTGTTQRNLVNAKNTPVVLVMAIAAFDPGSSVASPVNLHKD